MKERVKVWYVSIAYDAFFIEKIAVVFCISKQKNLLLVFVEKKEVFHEYP